VTWFYQNRDAPNPCFLYLEFSFGAFWQYDFWVYFPTLTSHWYLHSNYTLLFS
jgi:hypothetical protein